MRYRQVARKELQDTVRRRHLQALVVLFGLVGALVGYTIHGQVATSILLALSFLGPLVAISFTQHVVAGKRESSEMAVLLGLPFSRADIVVGSYVSQFVLVGVAILSAHVAATVVGGLTGAPLSVGNLFWSLVFALTISAIFVSITLGISSATASTTVASVGGFLAFFLFTFRLWGVLPTALLFVLNGFSMPATEPAWAEAFRQLSPYATLQNSLVPVATDVAGQIPLAESSESGDTPFYSSAWFAAPMTVAWLVGPALLGYLRFRDTDL